MSNNKGLLISFEGMEGAGKTTQCELLKQRIESLGGPSARVVREPGGVPVSEAIREIVLNPEYSEVAVTTEVLLFQAARAQLYAEIILPDLKKGIHVLMDRTRDSSLIYQGIVREIGVEWIEKLNDYSTQNTVPIRTFLLDLPAEEGMDRRMRQGNLDRIEQEGVPFQKKVCKAYLDVAQRDTTGRWVVIDGRKRIEQVAEEVWDNVQALLS